VDGNTTKTQTYLVQFNNFGRCTQRNYLLYNWSFEICAIYCWNIPTPQTYVVANLI